MTKAKHIKKSKTDDQIMADVHKDYSSRARKFKTEKRSKTNNEAFGKSSSNHGCGDGDMKRVKWREINKR